MIKAIFTLFRGRTADVAEAFTDAQALSILRQQLRDATEGLEGARRAVAIVMAYGQREKQNAERISGQIADLEARAVAALKSGQEVLAHEAAVAIADLETEAAATARATAHYNGEISRLREQVGLCEQRLRSLNRGRQIADAAERTQRLRGSLPDGVMASLRDAEATLARLQARQQHAEAVETALLDLQTASLAETAVEHLATAGFGAPLRSDPDEILNRLRGKISA